MEVRTNEGQVSKPTVLIAFASEAAFDFNTTTLAEKLEEKAHVVCIPDPEDVETFLSRENPESMEPWPQAVLVYHDALAKPENKNAADSIYAYVCLGGRAIVFLSYAMSRTHEHFSDDFSRAFAEMAVPWKLVEC
ncbi:hypothetical protein SCUCBS95973_007827 [Sporothrix curviconia]|uniref:Uncharacterized protein n=1 Tax=Sporothrix curviconia TaxID=1260050 RepID=A0ABP0CGJ6_9PEZI